MLYFYPFAHNAAKVCSIFMVVMIVFIGLRECANILSEAASIGQQQPQKASNHSDEENSKVVVVGYRHSYPWDGGFYRESFHDPVSIYSKDLSEEASSVEPQPLKQQARTNKASGDQSSNMRVRRVFRDPLPWEEGFFRPEYHAWPKAEKKNAEENMKSMPNDS